MLGDKGMIMHHITSMFTAGYAMMYPYGHMYMMWVLFSEVNRARGERERRRRRRWKKKKKKEKESKLASSMRISYVYRSLLFSSPVPAL